MISKKDEKCIVQVEFPVLRVTRRSPLAEVMQHLTFSADYDAETTASVHATAKFHAVPFRTVFGRSMLFPHTEP